MIFNWFASFICNRDYLQLGFLFIVLFDLVCMYVCLSLADQIRGTPSIVQVAAVYSSKIEL